MILMFLDFVRAKLKPLYSGAIMSTIKFGLNVLICLSRSGFDEEIIDGKKS